eukprot:1853873-Rhodomonas_salina.1
MPKEPSKRLISISGRCKELGFVGLGASNYVKIGQIAARLYHEKHGTAPHVPSSTARYYAPDDLETVDAAIEEHMQA